MPLENPNITHKQEPLTTAHKPVISVNRRAENGSNQIDPLILAYMYIFQSVMTDHDTAQIQAKGVQSNACGQNKLIAQEAVMNFYTLPQNQLYVLKFDAFLTQNGVILERLSWNVSKHKTLYEKFKQDVAKGLMSTQDFKVFWKTKNVNASALKKMADINQVVSADRGVMEDKISVLKQGAQVGETNLNSVVDEDQQSVQQGASLMQMLTNLTSQITRI